MLTSKTLEFTLIVGFVLRETVGIYITVWICTDVSQFVNKSENLYDSITHLLLKTLEVPL